MDLGPMDLQINRLSSIRTLTQHANNKMYIFPGNGRRNIGGIPGDDHLFIMQGAWL